MTRRSFHPVPVERPGGGRIADKTPPDAGDLITVTGFEGKLVPLHRLAAEAWAALREVARNDGFGEPWLLPVSGYRTVERQTVLWEEALARYGDPDVAAQWVARPGTSAHQTGRAIDCHLGYPIDSSDVDAMLTEPAYRWLLEHAEAFGFYPYDVEPWHWEYNPPWDGSAGAGA